MTNDTQDVVGRLNAYVALLKTHMPAQARAKVWPGGSWKSTDAYTADLKAVAALIERLSAENGRLREMCREAGAADPDIERAISASAGGSVPYLATVGGPARKFDPALSTPAADGSALSDRIPASSHK